eukprot:5071692-Pyramimonas_sp.AAC.1
MLWTPGPTSFTSDALCTSGPMLWTPGPTFHAKRDHGTTMVAWLTRGAIERSEALWCGTPTGATKQHKAKGARTVASPTRRARGLGVTTRSARWFVCPFVRFGCYADVVWILRGRGAGLILRLRVTGPPVPITARVLSTPIAPLPLFSPPRPAPHSLPPLSHLRPRTGVG